MNHQSNWFSEIIKHFILILGAVVVILPFYLMLSFSFKSPSEIQSISGGFFGSQELMLDRRCVKEGKSEEECTMLPIVYNYKAAFEEAPLLRYLLMELLLQFQFCNTNSDCFTMRLCISKIKFFRQKYCFWYGHILLINPCSCYCPTTLFNACKTRTYKYLRSIGYSLDHLSIWDIFNASIFHDSS